MLKVPEAASRRLSLRELLEENVKGSFENAVEEVTEAMRNHVRHFVTPLSMDRPMSNKVTLEGTGSYVTIGDGRAALTCEHVAKRGNLNIGFYGSSDVFGYRGQWLMDPPPVDPRSRPRSSNRPG